MLIPPFDTVYGRHLLAEVPHFAHDPALVVTMPDLWPRFAPALPDDQPVYFVRSMDEQALEADLAGLAPFACVVGLGGGQAIDAAKYFGWRRRRPLFQFPTSLSVDAVFGHRAAIRRAGVVHYVGWAVPESVFIDYDVIRSAPPLINRAGIGDVLCFHTGVLDWRYADARGRVEAKWPYDPSLADASLAKVETLLAHQDDVRDLTDEGIRVLLDGHRWGGASFLGAGWNPRHIEGFEHFFFYALEYSTGRAFLHGQPVCLGTFIGAALHDSRADELLTAIHRIGVDIRPEAMGLSWLDVATTLRGLGDYVRAQGLWYGIAHEAAFDDARLASLRDRVEEVFGAFGSEPETPATHEAAG